MDGILVGWERKNVLQLRNLTMMYLDGRISIYL